MTELKIDGHCIDIHPIEKYTMVGLLIHDWDDGCVDFKMSKQECQQLIEQLMLVCERLQE